MRARHLAVLAFLLLSCGQAAVAGIPPGQLKRTPTATSVPAPIATDTPVLPTPTPAPVPPTPTPGTGYGTLLWADEFDGTAVDTTKWSYTFPWGALWNHGANELQCNRPSAIAVSNGTLKMVAARHDTAQPCESATDVKLYDGALLASYPSFNGQGVYAEARVRGARGQGYWTGFWMAASDTGWPPEIDARECGGGCSAALTRYEEYYHAYDGTTPNAQQVFPDDAQANWHTVGAYWSGAEVIFYFDGAANFRTAYQPPAENMYLLLNFAIDGGSPPDATTPFPSPPFEVDYVRVWSQHP